MQMPYKSLNGTALTVSRPTFFLFYVLLVCCKGYYVVMQTADFVINTMCDIFRLSSNNLN